MRKLIAIFLIFASCVDQFDFTHENAHAYLVVEGYISNKAGDSKIKLSRSGIFQSTNFKWISNARVVVIENQTDEHAFAYHDNGLYKPVEEGFVAKQESTYYLRIVHEGQVFESDLVKLQSSLEIDSLSFKSIVVNKSGEQIENPRLELQVTTNIDENASRYYIYSFEETWLAVAQASHNEIIKPLFIYDENHIPIDLDFETTYFENITNCWPERKVVGIYTASTEGLSRNQLINIPVFNVSLESPKLLYRYSVLVNQYAISREAHHFLNMLEEFSENSGYLYDIQPGFIEGNIHNKSTDENNVIGTFYAASHTSSRTFKSNTELSLLEKFIVLKSQPLCENIILEYPIIPPDSLPDSSLTSALLYLRDSLLTYKGLVIANYYEDEKFGVGPVIVLQLSNKFCINCKVFGTNEKPIWWD